MTTEHKPPGRSSKPRGRPNEGRTVERKLATHKKKLKRLLLGRETLRTGLSLSVSGGADLVDLIEKKAWDLSAPEIQDRLSALTIDLGSFCDNDVLAELNRIETAARETIRAEKVKITNQPFQFQALQLPLSGARLAFDLLAECAYLRKRLESDGYSASTWMMGNRIGWLEAQMAAAHHATKHGGNVGRPRRYGAEHWQRLISNYDRLTTNSNCPTKAGPRDDWIAESLRPLGFEYASGRALRAAVRRAREFLKNPK